MGGTIHATTTTTTNRLSNHRLLPGVNAITASNSLTNISNLGTTIVCFLRPIGALFRPATTSSKLPVFEKKFGFIVQVATSHTFAEVSFKPYIFICFKTDFFMNNI